MAVDSNALMRIGVVAPGGRIASDVEIKVQALVAGLAPDRRPDIRFHPQCFLSSGHFAGDDAARAEAFVAVANDPNLDVVWFARGGYGSFRLIEVVLPQLDAAAHDKTYLGYSDAGALLGALYGAGIGRVVHGPMPADVNRAGGAAAVLRALAFLADGTAPAQPSPTVAFNNTVLAHLIGTPHMPDLARHVLMLEEVSEPMYRIDRALGQITSALPDLTGIMLGRCSGIVANDPDFGETEEDVARYWCARTGIPYLGRADIGHDADNAVVPFGTWPPQRFK